MMVRGKIWEKVVTRFETVRNSITLLKHTVFTRPLSAHYFISPTSRIVCAVYDTQEKDRMFKRETTTTPGSHFIGAVFRYIILVANVNDIFLEKFETSITLCKHIFTVLRFNFISSVSIVNNRWQDGKEVPLDS